MALFCISAIAALRLGSPHSQLAPRGRRAGALMCAGGRMCAQPASGTEPWGSWSHSEDAISLELDVQSGTSEAAVRCECQVGFLDVRVGDVPLLSGRLAHQVRPQQLAWCLRATDQATHICVTLPKETSTAAADAAAVRSLRIGGDAISVPGLVVGAPKLTPPPLKPYESAPTSGYTNPIDGTVALPAVGAFAAVFGVGFALSDFGLGLVSGINPAAATLLAGAAAAAVVRWQSERNDSI